MDHPTSRSRRERRRLRSHRRRVAGALGTAFVLVASAVVGAVVWSGAGEPRGIGVGAERRAHERSVRARSRRRGRRRRAPRVHRLGRPHVGVPAVPGREGLRPPHVPRQPDPQLLRRGTGPAGTVRSRGSTPTTVCAPTRGRAPRCTTGAATGGPASPRCSSVTGARGSCSTRTTARSTWSTVSPATTSCPPFFTGDIIKGSVTIDPDGYPLIYTGSRDNKFRVLAFDRPQLTELWSLDANAVSPTLWNDDWDSSALVLHDWLFEGGENSQIHAVKLNRAMGADNLVTVAPDLRVARAGLGRGVVARLRQHRRVDRDVGGGVRQHAVLHELGRAGAGLGHRTAARRVGRPATRVPLLGRRRHRRHHHRRRAGDALPRGRMGAASPRARPRSGRC